MNGTKTETLYCSFCGESRHEVAKLIAERATLICDNCVWLCFGLNIDLQHWKDGL